MKLCLLIFALLAILSQLQAAEVRGLRVWEGPERTRAVLDLSATLEYKIFTLPSPDRVVIDIEDSYLSGDLARSEIQGLLKGVRTGERGSGLRIVFDLTKASRIQSFLLPPAKQYGHRLVVDLHQKSSKEKPVRRTVETIQPKKMRDLMVAISPGHGGEDPGAIGQSGTREKVIVLSIARKLAAKINREPGMKAVLVRGGDYYVEHRKRMEIARDKRADLFIAIHADAFKDRRVKGSSVFVLSNKGASSEAAQWLADQENAADLVGGVRLDDKGGMLASVLLDLSQTATRGASNDVAESILGSLVSLGKTHKNYVERANFLVLKSPDIPSVLVETAFISNPTEEKRLKTDAYQNKLANAILNGVTSYFWEYPPIGSWLASRKASATHVVTRGDTLSGIANHYQVSLANLRSMNKISDDSLHIGSRIKIPAMAGG